MADTPNPEWTDGVDTYGFPRWWALQPGESTTVFTRSDADRDYRRKDTNNRWREKIGAQVRLRQRVEDGAYLVDAFVSREFIETKEIFADQEPNYETAWLLHDEIIEGAVDVERTN